MPDEGSPMETRAVFTFVLGGEDGHEVVPEPDIEKYTAWLWANKYEPRAAGLLDRCRVALSRIDLDAEAEVKVSTVFLGVDHGWGQGPPVVFETTVFGGPADSAQWRYSTWDDAERGHTAVVRWLQGEGPEPE